MGALAGETQSRKRSCVEFVVGLGVAMTFPLLITFAPGSVGDAFELAATRVMLAPALAILLGPPARGAMADGAGLAHAQLMTPVIVILALAAFVVGEAVAEGRKRRTHASCPRQADIQ